MHTVRVNLGPRSYDIAVTTGDPAGLGPFVRMAVPDARLALVVSDTNTVGIGDAVAESLRAVGLQTGRAVVPAGEASKSLEQLARLYDALYELAADRRTPVVAVGGGVIGDLAGFAAATYNRGLPLIMVPTSLLAMVDSAVGGKTGINLPGGKNLVGAFHQPRAVWIDTAHLNSLPDREYRSGLAEIVKYGVILDPELFATLEANVNRLLARDPAVLVPVVARSCRLKADVVEQDEREETGRRAVLNYGHTFAHAFETVGGYGSWLHGEAVSAGMACAARLAEKLGRIGPELGDRQNRLLAAFGLPVTIPAAWQADDLLAVMRRDKKAAAGRMRFVLPVRLGQVEVVEDVPEALVRNVLEGR